MSSLIDLHPHRQYVPNAPTAYVKPLRNLGTSTGFQWVLIECPYCGASHRHGAGDLTEAPTDGLSSRVSHCSSNEVRDKDFRQQHRGEYNLALSLDLEDRPLFSGMIYFIRSGKDTIKIGYTADLKKRFKSLQAASAETLKIVGKIYGTQANEKELHKQFAHLRLHGEWFRLNSELLAYIKGLPKT